jgi:hypothetical protein
MQNTICFPIHLIYDWSWDVHHWLNDNSDFGVNIDPYTGKIMDELPHWRTVMHRERDGNYGDSRIRLMAREHADAIAEMRVILRERGIVSKRDFEKDSAPALDFLCTPAKP